MKKIIVPVIVAITIVLIWIAAAGHYKFNILQDDIYVKQESGNTVKYNDIIKVAASIIPISGVVNTIGWDYVEVENIIPAGVSPHGFDLSAQQMASVIESQKVFMIGLEHIDGFMDKVVREEQKVYLADGMELIELGEDQHQDEDHKEHKDEGHHDEYEHEHNEEHGHDDHHDEHSDEEHDEHDDHGHEGHNHHDHSSDAHVWMGKDNIIEIAQKVRDELTAIMPEQAEYFAANTEAFIAELETAFADFETQTAGKTPGEFIVFHDAYNYLLQSVGIDMDLKMSFSENVLHESGTAHLAELTEAVQEHGIKYIFSEPQFNTGNIEKFANDNNLIIWVLDPQGTNPEAGWYIENVKNNLAALAKIYE